MDEKAIPRVRFYKSATAYLQDCYRFRKESGTNFSYEQWAKELGLSSKSYLRFAVIGKRKISADLADRLLRNLKLSGEEKSYFSLLVLYSQIGTSTQKETLEDALRNRSGESLDSQEVFPENAILSDPMLLILRNYLSFTDSPRDVASIAANFGVEETVAVAKLDILSRSGLIEKRDGHWFATHNWIQVKSSPNNAAIAQYHRLSLEQAMEAECLHPSLRNFRSLSVALSQEEYSQFLEELGSFLNAVSRKFDSAVINNRRVYQINVNAFPWTEQISGDSLAGQEVKSNGRALGSNK